MAEAACWRAELESVFARVAGRFSRADLRWRMRDDLRAYVGEQLGSGGVLILDDTGSIKKGTASAGVSRQYTGTSEKTDNCQIGVFAAYATTRGRALVDRELYLPKCWPQDRERCRAAKIPDERAFAAKGEPALAIVRRGIAAGLPAAWVTADEAYGQDRSFPPRHRGTRPRPRARRSHIARSRRSPGSDASTSSCVKRPRTPGRGCPAVMAPRARASTTGRLRGCPSSSSSTVPSPPVGAGFSPGSPAPAGRSRNASGPRRTSAVSTSTRSAATPAGTGTSPSRCSRTPSSRPWLPRPSQ
ncbi:IS701 family transposase [Streptomyces niveiscabiei]